MTFSLFDGTAPSGFLPFVKQHLRIEDSRDDSLLLLYTSAAMEYVAKFTNRDWPADPANVPAEFPVAVLLLVADLYEHREAQTAQPLSDNKTVERLLWPHRVF